MGRIVVGLDGSESAARALRWAAEEAQSHGLELLVITAFAPPDVVGVPGARWPVERVEQTEERAQQQQRKWLSDALGGDYPDLELTAEVHMGQASESLLEAVKNGDMLVVGSRGRGGFKGLMLGSVSMQCVTHAEGPVTVIH